MDRGILFLGIVAIAVSIFGPYLADRFKRWCLAPRLRFELRSGYPYGHLTKITFPNAKGARDEFPVYYFGFAIRNDGKSLARSCEAILDEVQSVDNEGKCHPIKEFWPTNLMYTGGDLRVDINPGRPPIHIPIGHITDPDGQSRYERSHSIAVKQMDNNRFIFDFPGNQRPFAKIDSVSSGEYIFKVVIVGENFKPVKKHLMLYWSGNWTNDQELMLKKEAVISIGD